MLDTRSSRYSSEMADLIVVWASSDGVRCVLAALQGVLELRLEHDGRVLRRGQYIDIRPACDAAQRWRIDWDIGTRSGQQPWVRILCPECGDDAFGETDSQSGVHWLRCASCGEAWTIDGAGEEKGRDPRRTGTGERQHDPSS
jgi:hypothetical protein